MPNDTPSPDRIEDVTGEEADGTSEGLAGVGAFVSSMECAPLLTDVKVLQHRLAVSVIHLKWLLAICDNVRSENDRLRKERRTLAMLAYDEANGSAVLTFDESCEAVQLRDRVLSDSSSHHTEKPNG